jgi:hypothetical protein
MPIKRNYVIYAVVTGSGRPILGWVRNYTSWATNKYMRITEPLKLLAFYSFYCVSITCTLLLISLLSLTLITLKPDPAYYLPRVMKAIDPQSYLRIFNINV